jgi:predicted Zn-dependent protease
MTPRLPSLRPLVLALLAALGCAGEARPPELQRTQSAATLAPAAARRGVDSTSTVRVPRMPRARAAAHSGPTSAAGVRARLAARSSGTYIGDLLADHDSSLARWPNRSADQPLRVWVQPSEIPAWQPEFADEVREAFRDWQALGIPLRFAFTRDSAAADVHVTWVDHFREPISGKTVWARNDGWWIVAGDIIIAVHHNRGPALDSAAVKAIALHEVGHLLGLDHTRDTTTIMAPRVRVRELSAADRATMRLLYELPAGKVR